MDRKADIRKKIKLGELIIKAELDYMYPDNMSILYGMLLDSKNLLSAHPKLITRWQELGKEL